MMASPSSSSKASTLVARRLYRSLLRATKPFSPPSPNAAVLSCLLHRTGMDDNIVDWKSYIEDDLIESTWKRTKDEAMDLSISYATTTAPTQSAGSGSDSPRSTGGNNRDTNNNQERKQHRSYEMLFRRLLREVMAGPDGFRRMAFPCQVEPYRLRDIIRREFRDVGDGGTDHNDNGNNSGNKTDDVNNNKNSPLAVSALFDDATRRLVAFVALRELNKKISHYEFLKESSPTPVPNQAARHVSPLKWDQPSSYLRPGTFLVANPHLNDSIFSKSVIVILEHKDETGNERSLKRDDEAGMTYGLIVNKSSVDHGTGKNWKLRDVFQKHLLPERIAETFVGDSTVRNGGPVHFSFQMLYSAPADSTAADDFSSHDDNDDNEPSSSIGGTVIPMVPDEENASTALYSDRATYYQGDLLKAIDAVEKGRIDRGT